MLSNKAASAIVALASGVLALPSAVPMTLFESVRSAPSAWSQVGTAPKDEVFELRIYLAKQNVAEFQELALNIATPGHEQYGKHLSLTQIDAIVAPKAESKDLVFQWLGNHSLADGATVNARGNVVLVNVTISQAEQLLAAEYNSYTNAETQETRSRALEVNIPVALDGHISMMQPTTFFGFQGLQPKVHPKSDISPEVTYTTPTTLAALYGFSGVKTLTSGIMGIGGFIGQWSSTSDLKTFLTKFVIKGFANTGQSYTCDTINSGKCPTSPSGSNIGIEANLDVQYARAITSDIPNVFYSVGGNDDSIYEYLSTYILGLDDDARPNVISISYGGDESAVALSVATATCDDFAELGSAGVSVLFASGDSGVGTGCTIDGAKAYQPDFPGGCPWVTMVGGTTGTTTESAWTDGGGGFSNVFGRPAWQDDVVSLWLDSNTDGNTQYYNASGRAYPDVAAAATYFEIVVGGATEAVDGTSCAAPTFSSVIQLVNSQRLDAGLAPLGFLNPWLYGDAASALNDITSGSIGGCTALDGGFSAVKGWDPATGLGSPNYPKLLTAGLAA
ncbi:Uu.00g001180.m01.CDS01 [Anthostomella pinea]|uniref:tripeptidyl-peptidase II n=1 Tax=Anthostomella pinea TaxID=933095 RepID=A0AAI8VJE2_9PEZI|nr:Uu.00g001180.m01.CDS01 [Anthostomella pinea]